MDQRRKNPYRGLTDDQLTKLEGESEGRFLDKIGEGLQELLAKKAESDTTDNEPQSQE